jgi:3-phosphoshikimate 1-carboxyvinyltransferase
VPGDISAAAFWLVLAALHRDTSLTFTGVGVNPSRTALVRLLQSAFDLGVTVSNRHLAGAEPAADLEVKSGGTLKPFRIDGPEAAELIDELPVLAVAATQAPGTSEIRGAGELRVKESDRIAALATGLRAMGAEVEELEDGLRVTGPRPLVGAEVDSRGDHRIAMAFAVAAMLADGVTEIAGAESVAISDPGFWAQVDRFGALA